MLFLVKDKPKQFFSSIIMKATLITLSIHLVWKNPTNNKLKNNMNKIYFNLSERLTKTYCKLMFIQLSLTVLMLEEFIFDQNKLVKVSLLTMLPKEINYIDSIEITTESIST